MPVKLENLNQNALDLIGESIKAEFTSNEALRKPKEEEFLQSLRQIEMVYDPESEAKMSVDEPKMYPGYTRSKTIPLKAKLGQHLLPEKDRNWAIKPSPVPSVSQETLDYIVSTLKSEMFDETGAPIPLTAEIIEKAIKAFTIERSEKMQVVMADQLLEDGYPAKQKEQLSSGVDYGTGILKGALSQNYNSNKIVFNEELQRWEQQKNNQHRPSAENVLIFNFFPDMSSTSLDKCRFVDILYRFPRNDVLDLAKREDFLSDVIYGFIRDNPKGNYKLRDWEITAQTMGINPQQPSKDSEDYEIIERNCYIDGQKLFDMGISEAFESGTIDEEDMKINFFCNIWLLGNKIIKIDTWPDKFISKFSDIYHLFYYEKNETSIFGKGLPKILRYAQLGMAACDRHMLKNVAWTSGPCGEVNIEQLHASFIKDAANMHPGKFYVRLGRGQDANIPVLKFYNTETHLTDYLALKNDFRNQGDMDSSLPSYLFGNPTNLTDETAKGITVRFASMVDFIKSLVANFDEAHKSYLSSVYRWNMMFNEDSSIKGDMEIETIGSAAAIIHQAVIEQMAYLIQSLPDEAKGRIKWGAYLKQIFKLSLPEYETLIKTEEEYQKELEEEIARQQEMLQLQRELAMTKKRYDEAKAEAMEAKASKIKATTPHEVDAAAITNLKESMSMLEEPAGK